MQEETRRNLCCVKTLQTTGQHILPERCRYAEPTVPTFAASALHTFTPAPPTPYFIPVACLTFSVASAAFSCWQSDSTATERCCQTTTAWLLGSMSVLTAWLLDTQQAALGGSVGPSVGCHALDARLTHEKCLGGEGPKLHPDGLEGALRLLLRFLRCLCHFALHLPPTEVHIRCAAPLLLVGRIWCATTTKRS